MRILVTPTSLVRRPDAPALVRLRSHVDEVVLADVGRPLTESELIDLVPGFEGIIAGLDPYTDAVLAAGDRLRTIARYGTGVSNVDLDAAARRGITVTRTPAANALAVAELTVGLMLAVARGIPRSDAAMRRGEWVRGDGIELAGRTLGVVGFGAIGRLVAERAAAFGMRVIAYDPQIDPASARAAGVEAVQLDELVRRSHVLSLHVPLLPETRHLLDAERLALLPKGAIVVNTARGGLLDEHAAAAALDRGALFGVALDAYEAEPPTSSPLVGHPCVVATPHAGGHTDEAVARTSEQAVQNLLDALRP